MFGMWFIRNKKNADCKWNAHKQEWEIANYADKEGYCMNCKNNQKIKEIVYEELEKGDGLHCEICGVKAEDADGLTQYDGLLVDRGYECCDSCTEKLEQVIRDTINTIRDVNLRNKTTVNRTCPKCNHKYLLKE